MAVHSPSSCHGIVGSDGTRRCPTRTRTTAMRFSAGFAAAAFGPGEISKSLHERTCWRHVGWEFYHSQCGAYPERKLRENCTAIRSSFCRGARGLACADDAKASARETANSLIIVTLLSKSPEAGLLPFGAHQPTSLGGL